MSDVDTTVSEHRELEMELESKKRTLFDVLRNSDHEVVEEYELLRLTGESVMLGELFGDREDLIVVHNMGRDCPYCTMWADGFDGLHEHLVDRAAFVVCSPDAQTVQRDFACDRDWSFVMVSSHESSFTEDMGFASEASYQLGVSSFHRDSDGSITRIASRWFGPYDDYFPVWNLFGMMKDGPDGWEPQYDY